MRVCLDCGIDISERNRNAILCLKCAAARKKRPRHSLTPEQQKKAVSLAGTMYFYKLAKVLGVSVVNLRRFAATRRDINWDGMTYRDDKIREVAEYYQTHTLTETAARFPDIRVKSIVGKYVKAHKNIKWTDEEIVYVNKYTGLCAWSAIARKLGRNRYGVLKHRRKSNGKLNTLEFSVARHLVGPGCPFYQVLFVGSSNGRWVSTWVDIHKNLNENLPDWIKSAIESLARFQLWLHGSEENIYKALREQL